MANKTTKRAAQRMEVHTPADNEETSKNTAAKQQSATLPPTEEALTLVLPPGDERKRVADMLSYNYGGEALKVIASSIAQRKKYPVTIVDEKGNVVGTSLVIAMKTGKGYKRDYSDFLSIILADERNVKAYVDTMAEGPRKLMKEVLRNVCVESGEAENMCHKKFGVDSYYFYYDHKTLPDEYAWFTITSFDSHSWPRRHYFILPGMMRGLLFSAFFPDLDQPVKLFTDLPDKEKLEISNFEKDVFTDAPIIEGMFTQGVLEGAVNKLLSVADERKVAGMGIHDFTTDQTPGDGHLRARMLALLVSLISSEKRKLVDGVSFTVQRQVADIHSQLTHYNADLLQVILPYVKGVNRTLQGQCDLVKFVLAAHDWLGHDNVDSHWLAVDDLIAFTFMRTVKQRNGWQPFVITDKVADATLTNGFTGVKFGLGDFIDYITLPFLRGWLCLMASWGLLEAAFDTTDERPIVSPYDRLRWVRLTPLGRYAFKMTSRYTPPKQDEKKVWFAIDDDRLIFRSLEKNNPYLVSLKDVATPIGGGRYEVTASSFLAHCSSREDIEQKAGIFRLYIGRELPPLWKDFFDEMLRHCSPLKKIPASNYRMFSIAPDNIALQRLLTSDAQLRSLVIRAEGYRILVAVSNLTKFENRLKALGYLL